MPFSLYKRLDFNKLTPTEISLQMAKKSTAICYLLSMRWFSLEEESVMQQCSISISLGFENQGINAIGDTAQVTEYMHKLSTTCTQRDKGVVSPFTVTCKSEI